MSMELWVFSDRQLKSVAEWQAAIDAEGYPLRLSAEVVLEELRGFFPMHLREELSGCEFYHDPADELMAQLGIEFDHAWRYAIGFRWGGNLNEMQAAWMAATAYATATNGIVVDDQEMKIHAAAEARIEVENMVREIPKMEAIIRDLKQKQKPA